MKLIYFLLATIFLPLQALAQTYQISGIVISGDDSSRLAGVNVTLLSGDGSHNISEFITDNNGYFVISIIANGSYQLRFDYLGFHKKLDMVEIANKDTTLGTIKLIMDTTQLKGITIKEKQITTTQSGDTSQFNADAYKVNPDATTEDLIKKMPGITSDNNGVKVNGEDVKQVLVDGKPFFGSDPSAALKNLPADIIDKVQVFDKLSDQGQFTGFDDGQSQKTMNLITKTNKSEGEFGKIYGGDGPDGKYLAGLTYNMFDGDRRISIIELSNNVNQQNFTIDDVMSVMNNSGSGGDNGPIGPGTAAGIGNNDAQGGGTNSPSNLLVGQQNGITTSHSAGVNYNDMWGEKVSVSGSYFFNYTDNVNKSNLVRDYFNDTSLYSQTSNAGTKNYNNRANLRLEYKIDSSNVVTVVSQLRFQQNYYNNSLIADDSSSSSLSHTASSQASNSIGYINTNNVLYQHKLHKKGRTISFNAGTQINNKNGDGKNTSSSDYDNSPANSLLNQKYTLVNNNYTVSGDVAYTEPIGRNSQILINYNPSVRDGIANKQTYGYENTTQEYSLFDSSLSNKYNSTYITQAGGLNYRYNNGKLSLMAGTNLQSTVLEGNQVFPYNFNTRKEFTGVLPVFILNYKFSKTRNLHIIYRTATSAPALSQLQEVVDISNPLLPQSGNSNLKQDMEHTFLVRYGVVNMETGRHFFVFATGNYINNYISNQTTTLLSDTLYDGYLLNKGSQLTIPVNLNGYYTGKTFLVYGLPVSFIKSNLNFNGGISYSHLPSLVNNLLNLSNSYTANGGFYLGSNISRELDFSLSYNGSYNIVKNSIQAASNNAFYNHATMFKINWIIFKGVVINTDITHNLYNGVSQSYDKSYFIWDAYIGYKFFKDRSLEAKISVNDILNQNVNITHNVTESYIETSNTQVLKRYGMVSLTYTLRNFKKGAAPENNFNLPPGLPPPGSMPPPGSFPGPPPGG